MSKRLVSTAAGKEPKKKKSKNDELIARLFQDQDFLGMRTREVEAKEKEATASMLVAKATVLKTEEETAILRNQRKVQLLRERKKLLDEGVCTAEELDKLLPLD